MNRPLKLALVLLAVATGLFGLRSGEFIAPTGELRLAPPAEARVGRPLTPVSVAGVGRRTRRRCAAGVYNC